MSNYSVKIKSHDLSCKVVGHHDKLSRFAAGGMTHAEALGEVLGDALMSINYGVTDIAYETLGAAVVQVCGTDVDNCLVWLADLTKKMQALKARLDQEAQRGD